MRVRGWPASDSARLVAGIPWAIVLTVVVTFASVSELSGLAPEASPVAVASAVGAAALVCAVSLTNSTVSLLVVPLVTMSRIVSGRWRPWVNVPA